MTKSIDTPVLNIAYEESGNPQGFPIILLHGFPDDVHAWDEVAPPLAKAGHRVLVPYLRGYGPTRFRDAAAPRMAEQAAIGQDLIDFADALKLPRFAVSGFDWGGRAAGIAAALHPDRVRAAVLIAGYSIQNVFAGPQPGPPEAEKRVWYQFYFNTERGRAGLKANRRSLCKLLWQDWSPTWHFTDETYNRTAPSFDNPDFVDIVIHSYRHRLGNAPGEPRFDGDGAATGAASENRSAHDRAAWRGRLAGSRSRGNPRRRARFIHVAGRPPDRRRLRPFHAARKTGGRIGGNAGSAGRGALITGMNKDKRRHESPDHRNHQWGHLVGG